MIRITDHNKNVKGRYFFFRFPIFKVSRQIIRTQNASQLKTKKGSHTRNKTSDMEIKKSNQRGLNIRYAIEFKSRKIPLKDFNIATPSKKGNFAHQF